MGWQSAINEAQVLGSVLSRIEARLDADGLATWRSLGLASPAPDRWYPLREVLAAMQAIAANSADPATALRALGQAVVGLNGSAATSTLDQALRAIDLSYHRHHRGSDIGHYFSQMIGPGEYRVVCATPYPRDCDHGMLLEIAQQYAPEATVVLDRSSPTRKDTAGYCTFIVVT